MVEEGSSLYNQINSSVSEYDAVVLVAQVAYCSHCTSTDGSMYKSHVEPGLISSY